MNITYGEGKTKYGPGVAITLTGEEVARAITTWLTANKVDIQGPRTVSVNGEMCVTGSIYVDPSGSATTPKGRVLFGRGRKKLVKQST